KFAGRNKVALLIVAVIAALLISGTVLSTWLALRAMRAEATAEARLEAETAAREEARDSLRNARQAGDEYYTLVSENTLLQEPQLEPLRQQLLRQALRYYQKFASEHGSNPEMRAEVAAACFRIAVLSHDLGPQHDWLPEFQQGVAIAESLVDEKPDV